MLDTKVIAIYFVIYKAGRFILALISSVLPHLERHELLSHHVMPVGLTSGQYRLTASTFDSGPRIAGEYFTKSA